jgi:hypothetical protein
VLFLVFGSSCSGKTAALGALRRRAVPRLALHDFDEIGVPSDADTAWRQRANETWVRSALDLQARGIDLLLAAQTPYGELLATPSAASLEGVAACLVDCDDDVRLARLRQRGPAWLESVPGDLSDFAAWARWLRGHARDPRHRPEVLRAAGDPAMRWERWAAWREGDPRWRVRVVDSTPLGIDEVADALAGWIADERAGTGPTAPWL